MTPLLQQFLSESRDVLQEVGEKLIRLESAPDNAGLVGELFRLVHTLKGNCGLFDFPEMARVLHAAEDLMVLVRDGTQPYTQALADRLLEAMDFVALLLDEIETTGTCSPSHAAESAALAQGLRQLIGGPAPAGGPSPLAAAPSSVNHSSASGSAISAAHATAQAVLDKLPPALRQDLARQASADAPLLWIEYTPESECFFKGEDPFHQARQTPRVLWQRVSAPSPWPVLAELDAYQCVVRFQMVSASSQAEVEAHFRYVTEQVTLVPLPVDLLYRPAQEAAQDRPGSITHGSAYHTVVAAQVRILAMPDQVLWLPGRLKAVSATLAGCYRSEGQHALLPALQAAAAIAVAQGSAAPLQQWLESQQSGSNAATAAPMQTHVPIAAAATSTETRLDRRAEDSPAGAKTLKVDQEKVDRLMNLIGEMVVAKNGLPYLASRAETVFGVRELSREIKTQYAVINRIAEEMQDAIMQVRMMPVSFVFQRFPRLVRDIARKLGKEINLVLEGEDTEADKNIIEALADPLIHIVRNSLDHGFELPDVRRTAGKPAEGRLVIRASQESDRVVIDIIDDGKGIDPQVIKRKAYEKGIIDEAMLERISDQDAINLVFAAGFSTAEIVSDLSGRGVGMDVVRTAVEQVNGTVSLESTPGVGTRLRLSLPLSMAVTNVMVIESDKQIFGIPMDMVVETVRVPRTDIRSIKNHQTAVLRGRIVPLRTLNELLATDKPPRANAQDELATLVIRTHGEHVGIVVDDFREVIDIILKPMAGILGSLPGYAGSALMGDGSVLMVLNPKELV